MKLALAIASIFAALASPTSAQSALDHSIGTAVAPGAGKPRRPPPSTEPRFLVLSRVADFPEAGDGPCITTFVFRVRNVPAALYKVLGGFATNGVNMTKLESYMIEGNFFATQFYADVEGHPEDRQLVLAFEELAFFSKEMKILGVYPAHAFRKTFEEGS